MDNLIHQFGHISQFVTRITAGRNSRSHERPPFVISAVHNLGQNGFIKQNEFHMLGKATNAQRSITVESNNITPLDIIHDHFPCEPFPKAP